MSGWPLTSIISPPFNQRADGVRIRNAIPDLRWVDQSLHMHQIPSHITVSIKQSVLLFSYNIFDVLQNYLHVSYVIPVHPNTWLLGCISRDQMHQYEGNSCLNYRT